MSGCNQNKNTPVSDWDKLQGTWVGTESGREGEVKVIYSDKTIEFQGANSQEWYKGTGVLIEDSTPSQADYTITECAMMNYVGKISKVIYKLEENTLVFAGSEPGNEMRPTSFVPSGGSRVFNLKRQSSN
jgi:uncharacterized protein (TIGR03067 family)